MTGPESRLPSLTDSSVAEGSTKQQTKKDQDHETKKQD